LDAGLEDPSLALEVWFNCRKISDG
jgi:hypothetical protein